MKRNVKKNENNLKTTLFIPRELHPRMKKEMEVRGMSMSPWVIEAVREKLARTDSGRDIGWGPLEDLMEEDRDRIVRYIEVLRTADTNSPLREAVDKNFALYAWASERTK